MNQNIQNLIKLLLALHKRLLDLERKQYEDKNGPILNNNDYFNIVIGHNDFKWLRSLSEIISIIDEEGEQTEINENKIKDLLTAVLKMLMPNQIKDSEMGEVTEFSQRYGQALAKSSDLVIIDKEVKDKIALIM